MNKQKNLKRWGLSDEIRLMLLDWCAANYGGSATEIVEDALREHIEGRKANEPEMRKRFDAARARRVGGTKPKIVPIKEDGGNKT
jgi:hypothetical protein